MSGSLSSAGKKGQHPVLTYIPDPQRRPYPKRVWEDFFVSFCADISLQTTPSKTFMSSFPVLNTLTPITTRDKSTSLTPEQVFFLYKNWCSLLLIINNNLRSKMFVFLPPQKAIKERNIDLSEIEANILGTEREKQPPPGRWLLVTCHTCNKLNDGLKNAP